MLKDVEENLQFTTSVIDDIGSLNLTFNYGPEKTGFDCAKWLVDHCHDNSLSFPEYIVHSLNPVGSERIKRYIEAAKNNGFIK